MRNVYEGLSVDMQLYLLERNRRFYQDVLDNAPFVDANMHRIYTIGLREVEKQIRELEMLK